MPRRLGLDGLGDTPPLACILRALVTQYALQMVVSRSRRARAARKRKRRMDLVVNDLTGVEWAAIQAAWNGCAYCGATGGPMQRDCVLAISRGGRYTVDNVVPACASCNTSKCNEEVTTWLRRKRLDERAFLTRYMQIRAGLATSGR
jgi:5-methylcytosine-specific restriction endonuclease McrA